MHKSGGIPIGGIHSVRWASKNIWTSGKPVPKILADRLSRKASAKLNHVNCTRTRHRRVTSVLETTDRCESDVSQSDYLMTPLAMTARLYEILGITSG